MKNTQIPAVSAVRLFPVTLFALALSACGGGLMAPDPLREDPKAEAFLDRVAKNCADKSVGINYLSDLINNTQDAYFVDVTTKLFVGNITKAQYSSSINGLYPGADNQPGIDCIFSQL